MDKKYFKPKPDAFESKEITTIYNKSAIRKLEELESFGEDAFDLIIWLADRPINTEVFKHTTLGVLCFVNGEGGNTSFDFLGYDEFINVKEVIASSLVLYQDEKTPGKIIYSSWSMMPTMSISRPRNEHLWKIASLVPRALREIHTIGLTSFSKKISNYKIVDQVADVRPVSTPSGFKSLLNLGEHLYRFGRKALRKIFYKEQWILLVNMQKGASTKFKDFQKILPPKDRFWADPFLIEKEGKQYLFFEELPFATDKGHLSVMELDASGKASEPVTILNKSYHLSYPFIFEHEGTHYMIPESYQDRSIQVFESTGFPFNWEHKMNLMSDICAFDTTLYFYNNKWWMFTVLSENKGSGHNDELFLFFADTPFTTDWKSHPQNPVVTDVRIARPAGNIYEKDGKLIRPSQDCARKYGYGFNLNEIEVLTETEYREKRILNVRPDWDRKLTRTHSFNHLPGVTVIDAVIQRSRYF